MMRNDKSNLALVTGVLIVASVGSNKAEALVEGTKLIPHRAVYEMSMGEAKRNSSISGISGRMVFEFSGSACEGYTLNMRLVTEVLNRDGNPTLSDLRSSTWESGKGQRFRFNSSQYLNQKLREKTSGDAQRLGDKKVVDVKIKDPKPKKLQFPTKILFPTQHSLAVLKAASEGQTILQAPVYDGSENGQKLYATTTFIGKPSEKSEGKNLPPVTSAKVLDGLTSWPITISYFEEGKENQEIPSYQIGFRLYSNGVSRNLTIEYDDFSMRGALKEIEFLKESDCKQ